MKKRFGIVWEGPQIGLHSYAQVNRELCQRLIERGHEMVLIPADKRAHKLSSVSEQPVLTQGSRQTLCSPIAAHVRHQWPPSFTLPPAGHWVMMQPWEFGSLPRSWVGPMSQGIDDFWAYSSFVRDCYIHSGIAADRVHVIPLGVDPSRFHSRATPLPLKTTKPFKFLFVGGTISRKGIDLLLNAYTQTFTSKDPVCLVIKDMGSRTFYRGKTAGQHIAQLQATTGAPEIEYLDRELSALELAGLYTACDCLVHPYRGEGFGLPIAEAMASGLPVIVTGYGAALDYCDDKNAFLIPARIMRFLKKRIDSLETVDYPWLAEPDVAVLRDYLRHVVDHPTVARAKGAAAASRIRSHFTWDHSANAIEDRLKHLALRPVRRLTASPSRVAGPEKGSTPTSTSNNATGVTPIYRPRVSLCMIVKNEEAHLATSLGSVGDLVDEIVVVDTGSTDATAAVAAHWHARVYPFTWVDSFAAARNESLRHATGDWIFWLDADEGLDAENQIKLRSLLAGLKDENAAFVMRQRSTAGPGSKAAVVVDQVRLFRRLPEARWSYRVHEQILPALRRTGVDLRRSDVVIQHSGHEDAEMRRRKLDRDLRLLLLEKDECPEEPFILFNLGAVYQELDRPAEALPLLARSLERSRPRDSIVPKLHALITRCHRQLKRPREALEACRRGRQHDPDDVELLFFEALLQRELGDAAGAEAILLRLLSGSTAAGFANVDDGLRGYKARHNLAVIYEETGRAAEAEAQSARGSRREPTVHPRMAQTRGAL